MGTALFIYVYFVGISLSIFKAGLSLLGLCVFTRITLHCVSGDAQNGDHGFTIVLFRSSDFC